MADKISNYEYRAPRFRADFRLWVQTGGRQPELLDARCIDLSEDGLAAEILAPAINETLEIGARVLLIMTLPGNSTATKLAARVTNHQAAACGFAFIFSSKAEQNYIHDYFDLHHPSVNRTPE
jgi:hypothetical protein